LRVSQATNCPPCKGSSQGGGAEMENSAPRPSFGAGSSGSRLAISGTGWAKPTVPGCRPACTRRVRSIIVGARVRRRGPGRRPRRPRR
jgi:hypothetical protein